MKAACYSRYGGPEQITLEDVPTPTPREDEILVRVAAVSLNASDVEFLRADPVYVRAWGLWRPKVRTLGSDVAGRVEAVGKNVTQFKPGDHVFGDLLERWGGLAQYVAAPERLWSHVPRGLALEQACMIPQAGVVACQAARAAGALNGKRVLINGAGGGSGTFAIQIVKLLGAEHLTAVDHGAKASEMRRLGADQVMDFRLEDYTARESTYDVIIDLVGSRPLSKNAGALAPNGQYFLVGGSLSRILSAVTCGVVRSRFSSKSYRLLVVKQSPQAFREVAQWCTEGNVTPVLGKSFALSQAREAFQALLDGAVVGKVVVRVD